jgi:glutamate formiminotransferase/formiminotetrahydrofolate cyclodeaminase
VKALGFSLSDRQMVQVSMNLTDYRKTSMKKVFGEIKKLAGEAGVSVEESEIIGLLPSDALEATTRETLQLTQFKSDQIIEHRLAQPPQDPFQCDLFLQAVASAHPTPGGGSVSAMAGALAAALGQMMIGITQSSKKYKDQAKSLDPHQDKLEALRIHLFHLVKEDSEAYCGFTQARKMKNETPEEQKARKEAMDKAIVKAILVPVDTMKTTLEVLALLPFLAEKGNPAAISDIGVACFMAMAAIEGAMLNVHTNLRDIKDEEVKKQISGEATEIMGKADKLKTQILCEVAKLLEKV